MYEPESYVESHPTMQEALQRAKEAAEKEATKKAIEEAAKMKARERCEVKPCGIEPTEETLSIITEHMTSLLFEIRDMTESAKVIVKDEPRNRETCCGSAGPERIDLYAIALRQRGILVEIRENMQYILTALR
ncbi:MAG: hypothetical protein ABFD76_06780 [Smithella sp.]